MYLFLFIIVGCIIGSLIDCIILGLFEGIKKLTIFLTGTDPDEEILNNIMLITFIAAIIIIMMVAAAILYFILN